jgi:hypothetical protein
VLLAHSILQRTVVGAIFKINDGQKIGWSADFIPGPEVSFEAARIVVLSVAAREVQIT